MTVLIGGPAGTPSPARRDSDHAGADLNLRPGSSTIPLDPDFEYPLIVTAALFWWVVSRFDPGTSST